MSMNDMLTDKAVDRAVEMTAKMYGIPKETVVKVLKVGIPMMAQMADKNPELLKALYGMSMKQMPEPVQDLYEKMANTPAMRQTTMDDYKKALGKMAESLDRDVAGQTGASASKVQEVMGTMMPALQQQFAKRSQAMAGDDGEVKFRDYLKSLKG